MNIWRTRLTLWLTPLARQCPLSPNAISVMALGLNVIAAVCLYLGGRTPWLFLVAIVFVSAGGLADAFDGIVARVQGKESRYGDFLDHVADRISDLFLAAGWILGNGVREELALAAIAATMLNAYVGTQLEATYHERNYESVGRGEFVLALVVYPTVSYILATNGWRSVHAAGLSIADWMTAAMIVFALLGVVQRFALVRRMERRP
ncbi:MAG: CDP-diacylglycerol--glycerol-3-phosphate 3-phosphatidyltransferase PgsA [Acidobacteria bacterium]|nr:CDP-diacylglycerol--glycerol-3-phosphate 3-phosphatidyltransferase PgsA [Acidobacteriota bacterium]